jgi:hypothetical protein
MNRFPKAIEAEKNKLSTLVLPATPTRSNGTLSRCVIRKMRARSAFNWEYHADDFIGMVQLACGKSSSGVL